MVIVMRARTITYTHAGNCAARRNWAIAHEFVCEKFTKHLVFASIRLSAIFIPLFLNFLYMRMKTSKQAANFAWVNHEGPECRCRSKPLATNTARISACACLCRCPICWCNLWRRDGFLAYQLAERQPTSFGMPFPRQWSHRCRQNPTFWIDNCCNSVWMRRKRKHTKVENLVV